MAVINQMIGSLSSTRLVVARYAVSQPIGRQTIEEDYRRSGTFAAFPRIRGQIDRENNHHIWLIGQHQLDRFVDLFRFVRGRQHHIHAGCLQLTGHFGHHLGIKRVGQIGYDHAGNLGFLGNQALCKRVGTIAKLIGSFQNGQTGFLSDHSTWIERT